MEDDLYWITELAEHKQECLPSLKVVALDESLSLQETPLEPSEIHSGDKEDEMPIDPPHMESIFLTCQQADISLIFDIRVSREHSEDEATSL